MFNVIGRFSQALTSSATDMLNINDGKWQTNERSIHSTLTSSGIAFLFVNLIFITNFRNMPIFMVKSLYIFSKQKRFVRVSALESHQLNLIYLCHFIVGMFFLWRI